MVAGARFAGCALGKPSLVRIHDDLPGAIYIVWSLLEGLGVPIASRSAEEVATVDVDGAGAEVTTEQRHWALKMLHHSRLYGKRHPQSSGD
jgi:hypothetical protein